MPVIRIIWKVVFDALWHFSEDDGWAMASHVALSSLMAVFPFLIFGTALASFLGADQFAETAVHLIFDTWPESIAKPVADEVVRVLTIPRGSLLTISVLAAAYFASNGVEALRIALNRAYRVAESRSWYVTRLSSLGFVLGAVLILAALSLLLVAVPLAVRNADQWFPWLDTVMAAVDDWGLTLTLAMLTAGLLVAHLWLPSGHRNIVDVLPGIFPHARALVRGRLRFRLLYRQFFKLCHDLCGARLDHGRAGISLYARRDLHHRRGNQRRHSEIQGEAHGQAQFPGRSRRVDLYRLISLLAENHRPDICRPVPGSPKSGNAGVAVAL